MLSVQVNQGTTSALVGELKQCGKRRDLQRGKILHSCAIDSGCHRNIYVASTLISMYSKCGSMREAQDVFGNMIERNVVSWTALILGYVENGQSFVALDVFERMDCTPNRVTFIAVLKACSKNICLQKGMLVHRQATELGFDQDIAVGSTLVDMYRKCGDMRRARDVFDSLLQRDIVCWNVLILGYVENGQSSVALNVFNSIDCAPTRVTFVAALKACAELVCLQRAVSIHRQARELGFEKDIVVANTLVGTYGKCGDILQARAAFDGMVHRDVVSWNVLILGYVENGQNSLALEMFQRMDCAPNGVTFVAVLNAIAASATDNKPEKDICLQNGVSVHRRAREFGFEKDILVGSTLVDMYRKCGNMLLARDVFDRMTHRDVVSWNVLILGYVENGQCLVALDVFDNMDCAPNCVTCVAALKACGGLNKLEKGLSVHKQATELGFDKDIVVGSTLVDMYRKCGDMVRARDVFDGMPQRDAVCWNVLILGYVENGESSVALQVFNSMNCAPAPATFAAALKACACMGALETGQEIHNRVCELGWEQDEFILNSVLDFYGKCGNMAAAEDVFSRMHSHDTLSWTALMGGYTSLGDTSQVFRVVKRMQESGLQMDSVTMLLILTACSHAGMVNEGRRCFDTMSTYGIKPTVEHYACMVDMLGRANRLEEALLLVIGMPFVANSVIWTSLLGACRKWGNVVTAGVAFNALVALNEDEGSVGAAYVLMRNIHEKLGMVEDGELL